MKILAAILALVVIASPAVATETDAKACAAELDANALIIFNATLPEVGPGVDMKATITKVTKSLVSSNEIKQSEARAAATAAAQCLKLAAQ